MKEINSVTTCTYYWQISCPWKASQCKSLIMIVCERYWKLSNSLNNGKILGWGKSIWGLRLLCRFSWKSTKRMSLKTVCRLFWSIKSYMLMSWPVFTVWIRSSLDSRSSCWIRGPVWRKGTLTSKTSWNKQKHWTISSKVKTSPWSYTYTNPTFTSK